MADETLTPPAPDVAVPEGSAVGDEALPAPFEPTVTVNDEPVPAQVTGPPAVPVETVAVHEVTVVTDKVITDPSDPLAVQVPDAGRGSLDLPAYQLSQPSPEQVFADQAAEIDEADNDEPVNPAAHE